MLAQDWRRNSALDNAGLSFLLEVELNDTGCEFSEVAPKPFFADMGGGLVREQKELNVQTAINSRVIRTSTND